MTTNDSIAAIAFHHRLLHRRGRLQASFCEPGEWLEGPHQPRVMLAGSDRYL